jgi:phosphotransferase system HPr (HPr) family protein
MLSATVTVRNDLGLHARAAAQLVRLARPFNSRITIARQDNGVPADAKSILSVLTLAAAKGTALELVVDGDDEAIAFREIEKLFETGFGERG